MNPAKLATDIRTVLDALLRSDTSQAYDLLTVMLGDAQYEQARENWFGGVEGTSHPVRSDYPKPEPRTEKN